MGHGSTINPAQLHFAGSPQGFNDSPSSPFWVDGATVTHQHAIDARIKAPIHGSSPKSSGHVHGSMDYRGFGSGHPSMNGLSKIETSGLPMDMSGGLRSMPVSKLPYTGAVRSPPDMSMGSPEVSILERPFIWTPFNERPFQDRNFRTPHGHVRRTSDCSRVWEL
jgi:hypothetical protein